MQTVCMLGSRSARWRGGSGEAEAETAFRTQKAAILRSLQADELRQRDLRRRELLAELLELERTFGRKLDGLQRRVLQPWVSELQAATGGPGRSAPPPPPPPSDRTKAQRLAALAALAEGGDPALRLCQLHAIEGFVAQLQCLSQSLLVQLEDALGPPRVPDADAASGSGDQVDAMLAMLRGGGAEGERAGSARGAQKAQLARRLADCRVGSIFAVWASRFFRFFHYCESYEHLQRAWRADRRPLLPAGLGRR